MNINQARNQIRDTLLLEIRGEIKTDQSQPRVYNISKDVMHSLQNLVLNTMSSKEFSQCYC